MALAVEEPLDNFAPKLAYLLLLKFEKKNSTDIQWGTLETLTPCFSVSFEHLGCTNFYAFLEMFSADVFNTKLVPNLLTKLL